MAIHRQRVRIGQHDDGTPIYKWVQAKTLDELTDRIVQAYIDSGRIWELLDRQTAMPMVLSQSKPTCPTFREYVEKWLQTYKAQNLKPTTMSGYRSSLSVHLYPTFGDRLLDSITTEDVQVFLNDRKHLTHKTLTLMLVFLKEILSDAQEDKLIDSNPAASRRIIIPSDKKSIREALPLEQVKDIIQNLPQLQEDDRRLLALLLFTGMRRGEVLGLRWEDIDEKNGLIHVVRNVTYTNNQPHIGTPKTQKGTRNIPLDEQLVGLLAPFGKKGFIIGGDKPITLTQFKNMWIRIDKSIDLHGATPHVFRHTYLTLAAGTGLDAKTLQTIAGHADIQTTMNRYVHSQPD